MWATLRWYSLSSCISHRRLLPLLRALLLRPLTADERTQWLGTCTVEYSLEYSRAVAGGRVHSFGGNADRPLSGPVGGLPVAVRTKPSATSRPKAGLCCPPYTYSSPSYYTSTLWHARSRTKPNRGRQNEQPLPSAALRTVITALHSVAAHSSVNSTHCCTTVVGSLAVAILCVRPADSFAYALLFVRLTDYTQRVSTSSAST